MRENEVEGHLRDKVRALGGECFKFVSPGRVGVPDRIVLLPGGVCCFTEVKAPGKRPTVQQFRMLLGINALGTDASWISTKADADSLVARLLKKRKP